MSQTIIEAILDEHIVIAEIADEQGNEIIAEMVFLQGVPGAPGAKGDKGDPGDVGGSLPWANILGKPIFDFFYDQSVAAAVWLIVHNMGRFPSVVVTDSAGTRWLGDERHLDLNTLELTFSSPFSGKAYLN